MLEIRTARLEDDAALIAIDDATWNSRVSPAPRPEGSDRAYFASGRRDPTDIIVAELDNVVVGAISIHQPFPIPSHAHVLEINGLSVHPAAQGQGIGRRLIQAAQQEAATRGATKLSLRVLGHNTPARHLYESCGFTIEGILKAEFLLDGELVDDILMACPLTP